MPILTELLEDELNTEKRKRIWTRKWISRRHTHGSSQRARKQRY